MKLTTLEEPLGISFVYVKMGNGKRPGDRCIVVSRTEVGVEQFVSILSKFGVVRAPKTVDFELAPPTDAVKEWLSRIGRPKPLRRMSVTLMEPGTKLQQWSFIVNGDSCSVYVTARFSHRLIEAFHLDTWDVVMKPTEDRRDLESLGELDKQSESI